jgi:hypothetical protein
LRFLLFDRFFKIEGFVTQSTPALTVYQILKKT